MTAACRHGPETSARGIPDQRAVPATSPAVEVVVPTELVDTAWQLVRIDGWELDPELPDVTLTFEPDRLSGSGGCNWYTGWLEEGDGGLRISRMAVTRRDCIHPRIMDREARYLVALEEISGYRLTDGELALIYRTAEKEARLVFEASGS
ncbi:MAG: META domain-containing protein [Gemmatimonadota bacterium]